MIPKKFKVPIQKFPRNSRILSQDEYVSIKFLPNHLPYNRLGVLINGRVFKSAAKRNSLRRIIFDSMSELTTSPHTKNKKSNDLLIITKPPIINLTKKELQNKLKEYGNFI